MRGVSDYAVVYDISSDAERRKVDFLLKGFGFRIQKSVFECRMNRTAVNQLVARLKRLDFKTGFVKMYRLEYTSRNEVIGHNDKKNLDDGCAFII
jgi:CRISPR-associated protein Cas2